MHLTSSGFGSVAAKFAAAAQTYRLPTISHLKTYARSGVLMTYGTIQELYYIRAVALAETTFGYGYGADIELPAAGLSLATQLFSESHSRFLATVAPEDVVAFEQLLGERATRLGRVTLDGQLTVRHAGQPVIAANTATLRAAWTNGPVNQLLGVVSKDNLSHSNSL